MNGTVCVCLDDRYARTSELDPYLERGDTLVRESAGCNLLRPLDSVIHQGALIVSICTLFVLFRYLYYKRATKISFEISPDATRSRSGSLGHAVRPMHMSKKMRNKRKQKLVSNVMAAYLISITLFSVICVRRLAGPQQVVFGGDMMATTVYGIFSTAAYAAIFHRLYRSASFIKTTRKTLLRDTSSGEDLTTRLIGVLGGGRAITLAGIFATLVNATQIFVWTVPTKYRFKYCVLVMGLLFIAALSGLVLSSLLLKTSSKLVSACLASSDSQEFGKTFQRVMNTGSLLEEKKRMQLMIKREW